MHTFSCARFQRVAFVRIAPSRLSRTGSDLAWAPTTEDIHDPWQTALAIFCLKGRLSSMRCVCCDVRGTEMRCYELFGMLWRDSLRQYEMCGTETFYAATRCPGVVRYVQY